MFWEKLSLDKCQNHYGNRCLGKSEPREARQKQYGNRCLGKAIIQAYAKTIMGTGVWEEANVRNMPRTVWEHMFGEKIM